MRLIGQWELSITPSAVTLAFTGWRYTTCRLVAVSWNTLNIITVRRSFSRWNISIVQIQISNITEDTSSLWVTHVHTEAQLRSEMDILNTITEDLRLKDWEHSLALKNITILEGEQNTLLTSVPHQHWRTLVHDVLSVVLWSKRGFIYTCIFIDP